MKLPHAALAALVALALLRPGVAAETPAAPGTDKLAPVKAQIAQRNWSEAIQELKHINDVSSADWNNLMGYSLRKSAPPDYAAAERHYNLALRIDPKHRGALEYSGELYLSMGDLPKAEQRLAALGQACGMACPEYWDLKAAIEGYKANGGKKS